MWRIKNIFSRTVKDWDFFSQWITSNLCVAPTPLFQQEQQQCWEYVCYLTYGTLFEAVHQHGYNAAAWSIIQPNILSLTAASTGCLRREDSLAVSCVHVIFLNISSISRGLIIFENLPIFSFYKLWNALLQNGNLHTAWLESLAWSFIPVL